MTVTIYKVTVILLYSRRLDASFSYNRGNILEICYFLRNVVLVDQLLWQSPYHWWLSSISKYSLRRKKFLMVFATFT